jgi:hypothetical protein
MSRIVQIGARRLPTILGGGILGIVMIGLCAATAGASLSLLGEAISAAAGMIVANHYA